MEHVFSLRPEFWALEVALVGLLIVGVGASAILFISSNQDLQVFAAEKPVFILPAAVSLLISIPIIVSSKLVRLRYRYYITKDEIIEEAGLINKSTIRIPINNIETIELQRGILALLFDAGSVCIKTKKSRECGIMIRSQSKTKANEVMVWLNDKSVFSRKKQMGK